MIVQFIHHGSLWKFDTDSRLIRSAHSCIPFMSAHTDLRNAAVRAKVDVLRIRSREQSNPLDLQGN